MLQGGPEASKGRGDSLLTIPIETEAGRVHTGCQPLCPLPFTYMYPLGLFRDSQLTEQYRTIMNSVQLYTVQMGALPPCSHFSVVGTEGGYGKV